MKKVDCECERAWRFADHGPHSCNYCRRDAKRIRDREADAAYFAGPAPAFLSSTETSTGKLHYFRIPPQRHRRR